VSLLLSKEAILLSNTLHLSNMAFMLLVWVIWLIANVPVREVLEFVTSIN
jgi:hypothetical protein